MADPAMTDNRWNCSNGTVGSDANRRWNSSNNYRKQKGPRLPCGRRDPRRVTAERDWCEGRQTLCVEYLADSLTASGTQQKTGPIGGPSGHNQVPLVEMIRNANPRWYNAD